MALQRPDFRDTGRVLALPRLHAAAAGLYTGGGGVSVTIVAPLRYSLL